MWFDICKCDIISVDTGITTVVILIIMYLITLKKSHALQTQYIKIVM